jgi:hypothetical protein
MDRDIVAKRHQLTFLTTLSYALNGFASEIPCMWMKNLIQQYPEWEDAMIVVRENVSSLSRTHLGDCTGVPFSKNTRTFNRNPAHHWW